MYKDNVMKHSHISPVISIKKTSIKQTIKCICLLKFTSRQISCLHKLYLQLFMRYNSFTLKQ